MHICAGESSVSCFAFPCAACYSKARKGGTACGYTVTATVSTQRQENPDKSKYESLLNTIIDKYRDNASDDWEWMQLGIYENQQQSSGPNTNNGFSIAKEINDLNVGPNGTMTDVARLIMLLTSRGYDCSNLAQYSCRDEKTANKRGLSGNCEQAKP